MSQNSLIDIFFVECEELLSDLESGLVGLEDAPEDEELINRIFRAAHTIKGNAGMVGLEGIVEFAHSMESVLDRLREKLLSVDRGLITDLLSALDILKGMIERAAGGETVSGNEESENCLKALEKYLSGGDTGAAADLGACPADVSGGVRYYEIKLKLKPEIFETGQDPFMLFEDLKSVSEIVQVEADDSELPSFEQLDVYKLYLSWRILVRSEAGLPAIKSVFLFVMEENSIEISEISAPLEQPTASLDVDKPLGEILVDQGEVSSAQVEEVLSRQKRVGELLVEAGYARSKVVEKAVQQQQTARAVKRSSSIRVETGKLDKLVNLVGELVIASAQVGSAAREESTSLDTRRAAAEALDRITRELQEQVMTVRMVPIEETFHRFKRVVRDLSDELGKEVVLETSGTETELDKTVIEQLVDPLKHMVRNCVDHGLEFPDVRVAAKKPRHGTIQLKAQQREGRIIIDVEDDGRGIKREAVIEKAIQRGLIESGESLTDRQVYDLLFQPGFSTAEAVTEISGRGVGLDVVKRNVEELNGTIEIQSTAGKGTTFRIHLPLTLAIIDGMNVKVGNDKLTFPLLSVVELIYPQKEDIETVEGKQELVQVRGEYIPMVRLHRLFDLETEKVSPTDAMIVVVDTDGSRFGVMVDDVLGMEQAVVKSLDSTFTLFHRLGSTTARRPDGIAGATILGDGSVSMILDVYGIERTAVRQVA